MASGDTLLSFLPGENEPPASNYATYDLRNGHPVLDFDDTTNESAVFSAVMPEHYAGTTGITVVLYFAMSSATSGDVDWDVAFERDADSGDASPQDIDADSFAAVNSVDNTTVPGTSGYVKKISVTFTDGADMDSVVAGDRFRLKVTRDAASDTASGDAELLGVVLLET